MNNIAFAAFALISATVLPASTQAQTFSVAEHEEYQIAKDAYVYAYPLLLMDTFMRQGTNYAEPTGLVTQAPYNQFSHAKAFPPADTRQWFVRTSIRSTRQRTLISAPSRLCFPCQRQTATSCCRC
jgi:hypothetical protein